MENVFRTRSETANRVYKYCRTGPDKFPIWFDFDVSGRQITSKGIACSESCHLLEILNEIFVLEILELSTDGHRWPPMDLPGLSVRVGFVQTLKKKQKNAKLRHLNSKQFNAEAIWKTLRGVFASRTKAECTLSTDNFLFGISRNKLRLPQRSQTF